MKIFWKKKVGGIIEQVGVDSQHCKYALTKKQLRYVPVKRALDIAICLPICVLLTPVMIGIAIAVKMDSPGPVFFKQKRVGKDKVYFEIWKFRTMRMDTPGNMPTHMLKNPEQYITHIGRFLRRYSIDELPQLYQCLLTKSLSLCGPRPALWNQYDLVAERDKYGANNVKPGITGWAQINGRDELKISDKARFDGEYVKNFGLWMDIKCLFATVDSVLKHNGVVEGGTGEMHKQCKDTAGINIKRKVLQGNPSVNFGVDRSLENADGTASSTNQQKSAVFKRVLITGANSYIGMSVEKWLKNSTDMYGIDTLDMTDEKWREKDFSQYDVVYHVAGIAHADTGKVTEKQKKLYYDVNRDLAVETAEKAKGAGVKQFIFMSSMIVYSGCKERVITKKTIPKPLNFYGDSKWQADQKIGKMADENFKVVVVRPPMIYGKGGKGNYPKLARFAACTPVFPIVKNKRSMLYIDNLCQFIKLMIDNEANGVFFPQNKEYVNTSDMVQMIAKVRGHRTLMIPFMNLSVKLIGKVPGEMGRLVDKAFGDFVYEKSMSEYKKDYIVNTFLESIRLTEGAEK